MSFLAQAPKAMIQTNNALLSELIFGTIVFSSEHGATYGRIKKVTLQRSGETLVEEGDDGQALAHLVYNAKTECTVESVWYASKPMPGIGHVVKLVGMDNKYGQVTEGTATWESKGYRSITIKIVGYDTLTAVTENEAHLASGAFAAAS